MSLQLTVTPKSDSSNSEPGADLTFYVSNDQLVLTLTEHYTREIFLTEDDTLELLNLLKFKLGERR